MSKALALLAGLGAGYMNGEKEKAKQARQDKLDKQQDELHTFKVDEFKRLNDDRAALQTTTAPATAREMEGPQTESVIAATPAGQEPAPLGYIAGNGTSARGFAEKGLADAEATAQNKPEARRTRMADLAMQGNAFAATALRDSVQTDAAMGQLKEQTELQGHREFARNVVGSFQNGWGGFTQFATDKFDDGNTYTATEDGKGGAVIVSTGKDGKEVGRQAFASPEEAIAFSVSKADPMKWVDYKTNAANKKADQANKDRDFQLRKDESESNADYRKRTLAIQGSQEARARAVHKAAMADAEIPPAVKLQATSLAKQMENIGSALNKAMAEGNFKADDPGTKELLKNQARIGDQYQSLLASYIPGTKAGNTENPFGFGSSEAAPRPSGPPVAAGRPIATPPATPAQVPAKPVQQFNEAGYADVQSTIDGAKRGDARARALLGVMINRGVTTPAQRTQIYEISK